MNQTFKEKPIKRNQRKFSPQQEQLILERLSKGEKKANLVKEFGGSISTINRIIERAGRKPPRKNTKNESNQCRDIKYSQSNHSPRLSDLRDPKHPASMAMIKHKRSFFNAMGRLFKDLDRAEKSLLTLQNVIGEDFATYHGAMLARWAAYEVIWEQDLITHFSASSFVASEMALQARLKTVSKRIKESLSHLDRIQKVSITIEN